MRWDTFLNFCPCCMGKLTNELPDVNVYIILFLSVYASVCYYTIHVSGFDGDAVVFDLSICSKTVTGVSST